ncbi:SIR2 family protein [Paludibaculum fermentans]|uniref:SIR2 family protein n=1 Tax=Paludibaculum fermentans TaxID=1473598 RepID=UPI003EBA141A
MAIYFPDSYRRELRKAWSERRLVPYLGAGVSAPYGLPQWTDLVMRILIDESWETFGEFWKNYQTPLAVWMTENFDFGLESLSRFAKSKFVVNTGKRQRRHFNDYVDEQLYKKMPATLPAGPTTLTAVADLIAASEGAPGGRAIPAVVSLNFDDLLETELKARHIACEPVFGKRRRHASRLGIIHAHGYLPRGARAPASDLIFTEDDYHRFALQSIHWAQVELLSLLRNGTGLFIGLSMSDANLRRLLDATADGRKSRHFVIRKRFSLNYQQQQEAARRIHERAMTGLQPDERNRMMNDAPQLEFAIDRMLKAATEIDTTLLEEMGVATIWVDEYDEIPKVLQQIPSTGKAAGPRAQRGKP